MLERTRDGFAATNEALRLRAEAATAPTARCAAGTRARSLASVFNANRADRDHSDGLDAHLTLSYAVIAST